MKKAKKNVKGGAVDGVSDGVDAIVSTSETKIVKSKPKKLVFNKVRDLMPKQVEQYIMDVLNDQCYKENLTKTYETPDGLHTEEFGMYWFSKLSNQPFQPVGMEDQLTYLVKFEINDQLTHGLGFSSTQQKWYGWSHRALFGFGIGSTCVIGDAHYKASNKDEMIKSCTEFWGNNERDEEGGYSHRLIAVEANVPEPESYCTYDIKEEAPQSLLKAYDSLFEVKPAAIVESAEGEIPERDPIDPNKLGVSIITRTEFFGKQEGRGGYISTQWTPYPETWGRGTWTATTLDEAMEMASDFSDGVS